MYEGLVCACCLATEGLLELEPRHPRALAACFRIRLSVKDGHSHICDECSRRLFDADAFRRQVLATLAVLTPHAVGGSRKVKKEEDSTEEDESQDSSSAEELERRKSTRIQSVKKEKVGRSRKVKKEPDSTEEDESEDSSSAEKLKRKKTTRKEPVTKVVKTTRSKPLRLLETPVRTPIVLTQTPKCPTYTLDPKDKKCPECPAAFDSHRVLVWHINEHYPNFKCRECGKVFMTRTRWWTHQRSHRPGEYRCKICNKVFANQNTLFSHRRNTHSTNRLLYPCTECGERFETLHKRIAHTKEKHGLDKRYRRFVKKSRSKSGRPRSPPRTPIESKTPKCPMYTLDPKELKCRECPAEFESHRTLKYHINSHYPNFKCRECGKAFMTKMRWWTHQRSHKPGEYHCHKCDKVFIYENSLFSHLRNTHSVNRLLYPCTECGERFATFHKRIAHIKEQHGLNKLYPCPQCDKTFAFTFSRTKHIRETHDTRLYDCPLCSYRSKPKYLKAHLASKHKVGEKRNICPACGQGYERRATLKEHMRTHFRDRQFKCQFCLAHFIQKGTLKLHLQIHFKHGDITQEELLGANLQPLDLLRMTTDEMIRLLKKERTDNEVDVGADEEGNEETNEGMDVEELDQEFLDVKSDECEDLEE